MKAAKWVIGVLAAGAALWFIVVVVFERKAQGLYSPEQLVGRWALTRDTHEPNMPAAMRPDWLEFAVAGRHLSVASPAGACRAELQGLGLIRHIPESGPWPFPDRPQVHAMLHLMPPVPEWDRLSVDLGAQGRPLSYGTPRLRYERD